MVVLPHCRQLAIHFVVLLTLSLLKCSQGQVQGRYTRPHVSWMYPLSGPSTGGTQVHIHGAGFLADEWMFNTRISRSNTSSVVVNVTFVNSTLLTFVMPPSDHQFDHLLDNNSSDSYAQLQLIWDSDVKIHQHVHDFLYYDESAAVEVTPTTISAYRGSKLTITGSFYRPAEVSKVLLRCRQVSDPVSFNLEESGPSCAGVEDRQADAMFETTATSGTLIVTLLGYKLPHGVNSVDVELLLALNGQDFIPTNHILNITTAIKPLKVCFLMNWDLTVGYGWDASVGESIVALKNEFGEQIETYAKYNVGTNVAAWDRDAYMQEFVDEGCKVAVMTLGLFRLVNWNAHLPANATMHFIMGSGGLLPPKSPMVRNVGWCSMILYDVMYLMGMVAGSKTETNLVGFVGNTDKIIFRMHLNAFAMGVRVMNPNATVIDYNSNQNGNDPVNEKFIGRVFIHRGVDVVFQGTAEGTALHTLFRDHGLYSLARGGSNYAYAFGDNILSSVLRQWEFCWIDFVRQLMYAGEFQPDNAFKVNGLQGGYMDMAPISWHVRQESQVEIYATRKGLISGEYEIFCGPIYDNFGNLAVPDGKCMNDTEITNFHFYVEGIEKHSALPPPFCGAGNFTRMTAEFEFGWCETCPLGTFTGEEDVLECQVCPVGTFSVRGICEPCPRGTFAAENGTSQCTQCPPGYFQDKEGREQCSPCPPGMFANQNGSLECLACSPSEYNPDYGAVACTSCPSFSSTARSLAISATECQCLDGYFSFSNDTLPPCGKCPSLNTSVAVTSKRRGVFQTHICQASQMCAQVEERSFANIQVRHVLHHYVDPVSTHDLVTQQCPHGDSREALHLPVTGKKLPNLEWIHFIEREPEPNDNIHTSVHEANVTESNFGQFTVDIFTGGHILESIPILLELVEFGCPISKSVQNGPDGLYCAFPSSAKANADSGISLVATVLIATFGVSAVAMIYLIYRTVRNRGMDHSWKIQSKDLLVDEDPEVIGFGTFGLVFKATFRGTPVAVKKVLPTVEGGKSHSVVAGSGSAKYVMIHIPSQNEIPNTGILQPSDSPTGSASPVLAGLEASGSLRANDMSAMQINDKKSKTHRLSLEKKKTPPNTFTIAELPKSGISAGMSNASGQSKDLIEQFRKEVQVVVYLRHPNITMVLGAVMEPDKEPLLVMEFMERGSLYELLHNDTFGFDANIIMTILNDIVAGMVYLHAASPPVLHNDIKSGNILIDSHFRAKLADFGFSMKKSQGLIGTPFWMAPEILQGKSPSTETDVYSFGILLFELFTRKEPYEWEDPAEVLERVADHTQDHRPDLLGKSVPDDIVDLMRECWNKDPAQRPTFTEIARRLELVDMASIENALHWQSGTTSLKRMNSHEASSLKDRNLLEQVFPSHIVEALKMGRKVEPEQHECVTIFFSDIVGFTDVSRKLQPLQVMNMLDRLYLRLDALARDLDVFKVETIGDAYMAVSNLIHSQPDHTARMCKFAFETINAANSTRILFDTNEEIPEGVEEFVHLRVGLHSGPVVASVVGNLNPRFCLFGDTVNTASRMESNSEKDCVHLSEKAAILLQSQGSKDIFLEARDPINVKGKGTMQTFWARHFPLKE